MNDQPPPLSTLGISATDFETLLSTAEAALTVPLQRVTINDLQFLTRTRTAYTTHGLSMPFSRAQLDYLKQLAAR